MWTDTEQAQSAAATQMSLATSATPAGRVSLAARLARAQRAASGNYAMSWRDVAQSFAHDAAEMPIVSRLLAGQVVLALGYFGLRGALALRERAQTHHTSSRRLGWLTAGVGVACAWAALALVSRTRAAPAVTALFTYGHALRQYFPPRRQLPRAA